MVEAKVLPTIGSKGCLALRQELFDRNHCAGIGRNETKSRDAIVYGAQSILQSAQCLHTPRDF